jgi:hypothetical protein
MVMERGGGRPEATATQARPLDPLAGLLSYLVPGLGQIYQGRVLKGLVFLASIYTLFFYGMRLGSGSVSIDGKTYTVSGNVYLPHTPPDVNGNNNPLHLPPFAFNLYSRPQFLGQFWVGVVAWPALWHYFREPQAEFAADHGAGRDAGGGLFGNFERTPKPEDLNALTTAGDKRIDLAWVYTVIAGVLNIMVIYDALAGPAFLSARSPAGAAEAVT